MITGIPEKHRKQPLSPAPENRVLCTPDAHTPPHPHHPFPWQQSNIMGWEAESLPIHTGRSPRQGLLSGCLWCSRIWLSRLLPPLAGALHPPAMPMHSASRCWALPQKPVCGVLSLLLPWPPPQGKPTRGSPSLSPCPDATQGWGHSLHYMSGSNTPNRTNPPGHKVGVTISAILHWPCPHSSRTLLRVLPY